MYVKSPEFENWTILVQENVLVLRRFAEVFRGVKDHDLSRWFTNNRRTTMIISIIYIKRVITQNGIW